MKLSKNQEVCVLARLANGELGFVAEWRGAKIEHIVWEARAATATEKARSAGEMTFVTHTVEVGEAGSLSSFGVRVRVEKGAEKLAPDSFAGLVKGQTVWVPVETFYREKGVVTVEAKEIVVLLIDQAVAKAA